MNLSRKTAVAGVYEHPSRYAPDKSMFQIMAESIRGALVDASRYSTPIALAERRGGGSKLVGSSRIKTSTSP